MLKALIKYEKEHPVKVLLILAGLILAVFLFVLQPMRQNLEAKQKTYAQVMAEKNMLEFLKSEIDALQ